MITIKAFQPNHTSIFDEIIYLISQYFKISEKKLKSKTRKREIVESRHLCFYFLYKFNSKHYRKTLAQIAEPFCKDHASVLHSIKKVNQFNETDKNFKTHFDFLNTVFEKKYNNKTILN